MIKKNRSLLMLSLLLASQAIAGVASIRAGDVAYDGKSDFKGQTASESGFGKSRLIITSDARIGYDDNTTSRPDNVKSYVYDTVFVDPVTLRRIATNRRTVESSPDNDDSLFVNFDVGLGYTIAGPRFSLSLGGDVGVNYYFDRPGRDYDVNGGVTLAFVYKLTPRALLNVSSYNAYTSSANFGASNLTGFNAGVANGVANASGVTSANNNAGDFFYTANRLSLTYQWTQRFSTVSGYNIVAFAYRDEDFARQQDRVEHYYSQEFRYLVAPTITAVAEYRFGYIGYLNDRIVLDNTGVGVGTVNNDNFQHFALVGANINLSQRLSASFRVGAQFREYVDYDDNDSVSPYVEASVNYNLSRLASVNFLARYSSEEGNIALASNDSNTLRLGISYNQAFGARLSGYLSFYYTHSNYDGDDTFAYDSLGNPIYSRSGARIRVYPGSFEDDTFDVAVGLRYSINRLLSVEGGYTHTSVFSGINVREYDRNRVFGGLRVVF